MKDLRWGEGQKKRHAASEIQACREAIITAATACYERLGLETTSTDIAAEAKITRQTVYKYFDGQQQLRLSVVDRIWRGLRPEQGSAEEWLESLRRAREYRLGQLTLSDDLFPDIQTVVLVSVKSVRDEGCARLFLSYLQIESLTGSPLPLFQAILGESNYRFENGEPFIS
jgi:AcrR family transcriptional regulator